MVKSTLKGNSDHMNGKGNGEKKPDIDFTEDYSILLERCILDPDYLELYTDALIRKLPDSRTWTHEDRNKFSNFIFLIPHILDKGIQITNKHEIIEKMIDSGFAYSDYACFTDVLFEPDRLNKVWETCAKLDTNDIASYILLLLPYLTLISSYDISQDKKIQVHRFICDINPPFLLFEKTKDVGGHFKLFYEFIQGDFTILFRYLNDIQNYADLNKNNEDIQKFIHDLLSPFYKEQLEYRIKNSEKIPSDWIIDNELNMAIHPDLPRFFPEICRKLPIALHCVYLPIVSLKYALSEVVQEFKDKLDGYWQNKITDKELASHSEEWLSYIDYKDTRYSELIGLIYNAKLPPEAFNSPQKYPFLFDQKKIDPLWDLPQNEVKTITLLEKRLKSKMVRGISYKVNKGHVTELHLSQLWLTSLPNDVGDLTFLEYLDIGLNEFKEVPPPLRKLKHLKNLHLEDDTIEIYPEWIGELTELEELHIKGNMLRRLPMSIGKLTKLKVLSIYCSHKRFEFPSSIALLTNLDYLGFLFPMNYDEFLKIPISEFWYLYRLLFKKNAPIRGLENLRHRMQTDPELMEILTKDVQTGDSNLEEEDLDDEFK